MKTTNNNPVCPYDKKECFPDMDYYIDCKHCPRYCNGVRETGGMPGAEEIYNLLKKLFKRWKSYY